MPGLDVMALDHDGCMGDIVNLIINGMPNLTADNYESLWDPLHQGNQEDRCTVLKAGLNWVMSLLAGEVNEKTLANIDPFLIEGLSGFDPKVEPLVFLNSIKMMLDRIKQADVLFCASNRQDAASDAGLAGQNRNGSCHGLIDMVAEVENERRKEEGLSPLVVNKSLLNRGINKMLQSTKLDLLSQEMVSEKVKAGIKMLERPNHAWTISDQSLVWGEGYRWEVSKGGDPYIPEGIEYSWVEPDDRVFKCLILHHIATRARESSPQGEIEVEFWDDKFTGDVYSFYHDNPELIPSGVIMKFMDCQPLRGGALENSCQALTEISRLSLKYFQDVGVDTMKGEIGKFGAERRNKFFELLVQECHNMDCSQRYDLRRKVKNLLGDQNFEYKHELAVVWLNDPKTNNARERGKLGYKTKRFENTQLALKIIGNLHVEQLSETFCEKLVNIACSDSSYKDAIQGKISKILEIDSSSSPNLAEIKSTLAKAWMQQTIDAPLENKITGLAKELNNDHGHEGGGFSPR